MTTGLEWSLDWIVQPLVLSLPRIYVLFTSVEKIHNKLSQVKKQCNDVNSQVEK